MAVTAVEAAGILISHQAVMHNYFVLGNEFDRCFDRRGIVYDCADVLAYEAPSDPWCVDNVNVSTGQYCEAAVMM